MPEVSIVLPTYNGERFIRDSIESVLAQTFTDWELIIVNDCSTDHTPEIVREYEARDSRIHVLDNPVNKKLPESLNIGFRNARGKYYTWTSDDNLYEPEAIEKLKDYLDSHPDEVMVCTGMVWIDEEGQYLRRHPIYDDERMFVDDMVGACFMYRSQVKDEIGEYDTDLFCAEDYEYWLRMIKEYGNIAYSPEILYQYRAQPNSLTATKRWKVKQSRIGIFKKHLRWIVQRAQSPNTLIKIYNEIVGSGTEFIPEAKQLISSRVPLVQHWAASIPQGKRLILFGAGYLGNKAADRLDGICAFADANTSLQGKRVKNIPVISYEEAVECLKNDEYFPVITVTWRNAYSVLQKLYQLEPELKQYVVYQDMS